MSTAYVIWDRINCPTRDFIAAQLGAAENAGTLTSEEAIGERCKQRAVQLSELRQALEPLLPDLIRSGFAAETIAASLKELLRCCAELAFADQAGPPEEARARWGTLAGQVFGAMEALRLPAMAAVAQEAKSDGRQAAVPILEKQTPPPLVSLGERIYRVSNTTFAVEDAEDNVLSAFFEQASRAPKWVSLNKPDLVKMSGQDNATRILTKLRKKYPALAGCIHCPGRKGMGGYRIYLAGRPKAT